MALTYAAVLSLSTVTAFAAVGTMVAASEREWALQLGYFSSLQNALNFKDRLIEAGFEAETVSTGRAGKQSYRVIGGWADDPEQFDALRNRIEDAMGERGYVVKNPYLQPGNGPVDEAAEEVFEQPRSRILLAQAGGVPSTGGESIGSAAVSGYDPGVFRSPQDEINSIPGFTGAGLQIIPTIGLSFGYDDNITRSNKLEQSSYFYRISPAIRAELPSDHSVLALTAAIDFVRYSDSPTDDSDPWYIGVDWAWDISTRQDLNLFVRYSDGTDARGTGRRQGDAGLIPVAPDEWRRIDYGGAWRYGAVGSRGRLDLMLGGSDLDYSNNKGRTEDLDRDWQYMGATFYWRVAPKTSLLANVRYNDINYDIAGRDSEVTTWMLGATWDASARTSGRISYGNQKKKFDDPEYEDYNGPAWVASISWRPRTYSVFTLTGSRNTQEPDGDGDYVLRQGISLAWFHDWATKFGTIVDVGYDEDDYRPDGRTDDLFYWGVAARYAFNPHFRFGASIQAYDRDSKIEEYNYKRHIYMLTLEASF